MNRAVGLVGFIVLLVSATVVYAVPSNPREQYKQAMGLLLGNNKNQSDQSDALRLFRLAADQGYGPAETALGAIYESGDLVTRDILQAVRWYTKAADQGDWIAQLSLGRLYFFGDGVPRDIAAAKKWLQRAAESGDGGAAFYLARLSDAGEGTTTNYAEALRWYKQSAEAGNPFAQQKLASLLLSGQGGPRDAQQAYTWLLVASQFGNHAVDGQLQSMESDLGKTAADAVRLEAVNLHDDVARNRSRGECNGWPGQYSQSPTAPPLLFQSACER